MKKLLYIFFFACLLLPIALRGQTPYDSFAPESSRPMLEADALYEEIVKENRQTDTILCAAVIDLQSQSLYLVSLADGSLLASAPLTDDLRKWLSVDPLVDKYIYASPYIYCNGNPIKYVDPDGREKKIFLNPTKDETLHKGATNYKDNIPTIHIWAHGSNKTIEFYNEKTGEPTTASSAGEVLDFLNEHVFPTSDAWQKHSLDGTQAAIVLHSCEAGKGDNSIAQQLSEQLPNTVVIAPTEKVAVDKATNKELGSYKTKVTTNDKGEKVLTTNGMGAWTIFRDGKPVVSFDGSSKPNVSKPESFHIE